MSTRVSPLAVPLPPLDEGIPRDEERPRLTREMVESLEGPASNRAEVLWAEQVAEQVAALWEGRGDGGSFEEALVTVQDALVEARERVAARRRR